jgi:hypothetical protein
MITIAWYENIEALITSSQNRGSNIDIQLSQMATNLNSNEVSDDDVVKSRFYNTIVARRRDISNRQYTFYYYDIINFMKKLQGYIDEEYPLINDFLSDNWFKVSVIFADMSREAGYVIDPDNIET